MYDNEDRPRDGARDGPRRGGASGMDVPKNSRIFVIGNKEHNESVLREHFEQFGTVESVWMVKDRRTGERKGVGYVKFSKASEAAKAMENTDGRPLGDTNRTVKVKIAQSRESGSTRDFNEDEELTRLFIVVPKSYEEDDIRSKFSEFGEVTRINVVKDRRSGENKGFAYVKYGKMSSAALALENCSPEFKPVFAEPRKGVFDKRDENRRSNDRFPDRNRDFDRDGDYERFSRSAGSSRSGSGFESDMRRGSSYDAYGLGFSSLSSPPFGVASGGPPGSSRLQVEVCGKVSEQQLHALFDIIPGLEYCDFRPEPQAWNFRGTAHVRFSSVQSAAYAKQKLHGFEFPPGCPLSVNYAEGSGAGARLDVGRSSGGVFHIQNPFSTGRDNFTCSVTLPPPQPLAPPDSPVAERLFVILTHTLHEQIIQDVFCRFGNLISYYNIHGHNYGYAKFADNECALKALETLHGQEICGERMKVLVADPRDDDISRKRQRID